MPWIFKDYWKGTNTHQNQVEDVLLSMEDLGKHSQEMASQHTVYGRKKMTHSLLRRLDEHYLEIMKGYQQVQGRSKEKKEITPASQWLLDNFYKVEQEYQDIRHHLLQESTFRLKILNRGELKGYPRIFAAALELVAHTDGRLNEEVIKYYFGAYQSRQVLTISEIWAVSLMLRLALLEKLRTVTERIRTIEETWTLAEALLKEKPEEMLAGLREIFDKSQRPEPAYIGHLLLLLRRPPLESAPLIQYMETRLREHNTTLEQLVEADHCQQAARRVTIGNTIVSMNLVAAMDWEGLFEELNISEGILRREKSGIYCRMDFESRDDYRKIVESIADRYGLPEPKIAMAAVELADEAMDQDLSEGELGTGHVGHYLVGGGWEALLKRLQKHPRGWDRWRKWPYLYPAVAGGLTLCLLVVFSTYAYRQSEAEAWLWTLVTLFILLLPASEVALALSHRILARLYPPSPIPRLDFSRGIPPECRTLVVIPALIPSRERVLELVRQLEIAYLANRDNNLIFALAGDFPDGKHKLLPEEEQILQAAVEAIRKLNAKMGRELFFYFHRERQWIQPLEKWMGWERKRGALLELNQLLLGEGHSYTTCTGNPNQEGPIRYVITLDADTRLPINIAYKLVGMMSHPLNQPVLNQEATRVVSGYGVIQPRVEVSVESANTNAFTRIYAGQAGIDLYTTAASDVYQDVYQEAIFTGKGIYDLQVAHRLFQEAIPEQRVLSHDLLEGSFLRCGLASDLSLIDEYPRQYSSYMMRLHRWVRGDWQLLPWLRSQVVNRRGQQVKNPLSALSKWKILDNLRRSLLPIGYFLLLLMGAELLPGRRLIWWSLGLIAIFLPFWASLFDYLRLRAVGYLAGQRGNFSDEVERSLALCLLQLIALPHQAYVMADAVIRTLYRLGGSGKNLLEWTTAADAERGLSNDLKGYILRMAGVFPLVMLAAWFLRKDLVLFLPLLLLWAGSPGIFFTLCKPEHLQEVGLEEEELKDLRRLARKTWAFYEDLVTPGHHYLPPDNYQEYPYKGAAPRTSPTNIGFYLLALLSGRDMGYLTTTEMIKRFSLTVNTINRLDTWKGHLYNWYDTRTLEVLRPAYVSTVDSGNFVAYLITAREGLKEILEAPLVNMAMLEGLLDALRMTAGDDRLEGLLLYELMGKEDLTLKAYGGLLEDLFENLPDKGMGGEKYVVQLKQLREEYDLFLKPLLEEGQERIPSLSELQQRLPHGEIFQRAHQVLADLDRVAQAAEFSALYDEKRHLFSIGYHQEEDRLTHSYYDLLASEARTTSYLAIARREVPLKHWYRLGRIFSLVQGNRGLVSWTGTMFEYFMPYLIMKNDRNTLLDETYRSVVQAQKEYGVQRRVPWGISESGYYGFDLHLNYQYKAFGIPQLGLKRGLIEELVIAPYSTLLALPYDPKSAVTNLRRLNELGAEGRYGFYEALDYTPERIGTGQPFQLVKSFMAHHQGMILVSINNFLNQLVMQNRFHRDAAIQAAQLLLHEKTPVWGIMTEDFREKQERERREDVALPDPSRTYGIPEQLPPACHLLTNGSYQLMIGQNGCGYSKFGELGLTRWRQHPDGGWYGIFLMVQHLEQQALWSATYGPCFREPDTYRVSFFQDRAVFSRKDGTIRTELEMRVSPEDPVEIRHIRLYNEGEQSACLQITSYSEIILTPQREDLAHPAFSNLFIRTEALEEYDSLLANRRPRGHQKESPWMFQSLFQPGERQSSFQYETNRSYFLGRGRSLEEAAGLNRPLRNFSGIALDPIMSLRQTIQLKAGEQAELVLLTGIEQTREKAEALLRQYHHRDTLQRAAELALTRSQVELAYFSFEPDQILVFQELASYLIFPHDGKAGEHEALIKNKKGQSGLWAYGVSGDLPIVLVSVKKMEEVQLVAELIQAHEYWRSRGIKSDLVILNLDETSYLQPVHQRIHEVFYSSSQKHLLNQSGGIFIKEGSLMPPEDLELMTAAARIILRGERGRLAKQVRFFKREVSRRTPSRKPVTAKEVNGFFSPLTLFNGYGGFNQEGTAYVIQLKDQQQTPMPWSNVIANESFGTLVTEKGGGYSWAENSRENKLTPWYNDPVSDPPGEVLYLEDMNSQVCWTLTPAPLGNGTAYEVQHGLGYTRFRNQNCGLCQEMTVFVPSLDPVKIQLIRLKNQEPVARTLRLTAYIKPVLGASGESTWPFLVTARNRETGGVTFTNAYQSDFPGRIAFLDSSEPILSVTGDLDFFWGHGSRFGIPQALEATELNNRVGAGLNPCGAIQLVLTLKAFEEKELVILLGQAKTEARLQELLKQYRQVSEAKAALDQALAGWQARVGTIQVKTPDPSLDLLLNGWLIYQTLSCRIWARSAFYQSGGAYGFRDQLQDAMNLLPISAEYLRKQILLHCAHQFVEGDVQHWWHPGVGEKGIRTRFSDDLLWLPYGVALYYQYTEDIQLLHEQVGFLEEHELAEGEDERYGTPGLAAEQASVYEHCLRAIERGLSFGEHGIPLMGSGDWNDGMNQVGNQGKGESVWMGWFLYELLLAFIPIVKEMGEADRAARYQQQAEQIKEQLHRHAWDGSWYLRAYYDNGEPLGSASQTECIIDSLAQSWSVISGGGDESRKLQAMKAVEDYLIKREQGMILLFTPPFDASHQEPGYIKSYVPGVRENGGQYTHAAVWVVKAYAMMGQGEKAWELFHMINPINHTRTRLECATYRAEPYVMAADVYAVPPYVGRGGWTWYTGAAGWMYRVGIEDLLGLSLRGERLYLKPAVPKEWKAYEICYRYHQTEYRITVELTHGEEEAGQVWTLDEKKLSTKFLPLVNDGQIHRVYVSCSF